MNSENKRSAMIMRLKGANCKNCYKCVRACPVKAISILSEKAKIDEKRCIYCGQCYLVCPQDARDLLSELDRVKAMIRNGEKVYISISSTFGEYFMKANLWQVAAALKKLGVSRVEETAIGTMRVMEEYEKLAEEGNMKNIFTSSCPASNFLIQKYNPELIKYLAPVDTPMEARAKMMRKAYGDDIRIVIVGPCIACHKLAAITQNGKLIDAYLNFEELERWMESENVKITREEDHDTIMVSNYRARYFDESGGVFRALKTDIKYHYMLWNIDGAGRIKSTFKDLNDSIRGYFMELMGCQNSCLGGPIMRLAGKDTFPGKDHWLFTVKDDNGGGAPNPSESAEVDIRKKYISMDFYEPMPTEEELKDLLALVGKTKKEHMLDCSGCGYPTCRDKAIAVYRGMADPFMCIPYARDKAEAESNYLFEFMPNGIVLTDRDMKIADINPKALEILSGTKEDYLGRDVRDIMLTQFIDNARMKELDVINDVVECDKLNKVLAVTFFRITRHHLYTLVINDMTEEAEKRRKESQMRQETIDVAQEVVQKQMRIAQEIASLLGETTAETKLAVNRMKSMLVTDEEEWYGDRWYSNEK